MLRSALLAVFAMAGALGAVIKHDAVVGFAQPEPQTLAEKVAVRFQPELHIFNGCQAFPAVDAAGNTGAGLKTSGSNNGGCSSSPGQMYWRSTAYSGFYAIMYSQYMPKDQPLPGFGHKHDWEQTTIWLDNPANASPMIIAVAVSQHGGNHIYYPPPESALDGDSIRVRYIAIPPINHALEIDDENGTKLPLIGWEQLTPEARTALENTDFGSAIVPFKDSTFQANLKKAFPISWDESS